MRTAARAVRLREAIVAAEAKLAQQRDFWDGLQEQGLTWPQYNANPTVSITLKAIYRQSAIQALIFAPSPFSRLLPRCDDFSAAALGVSE